jgi:hypothetical protein
MFLCLVRWLGSILRFQRACARRPSAAHAASLWGTVDLSSAEPVASPSVATYPPEKPHPGVTWRDFCDFPSLHDLAAVPSRRNPNLPSLPAAAPRRIGRSPLARTRAPVCRARTHA